MILNDTLQKHRECLERCERERVTCKLEHTDDNECDTEKEVCECHCDFDYGP
jgi:hypothetical protein